MLTLLRSALAYTRAGLSVIPCDRRTKSPRLSHWKPYQTHIPAPHEVRHWFVPWSGADAVAIVTGPVSGHLEVLDFDAPALFAPWAAAVQSQCPDLLPRLPIVQTQSGGYHGYFRCFEATSGNRKLAVDPAKPGGKYTLIETRGAGGYVLAPPSAGYTVLQGKLTAIPVLHPAERSLLLDTARRFNRAPLPATSPRRVARPGGAALGSRPGDDYNQRGDVGSVLQRHGWQCVRHVYECPIYSTPPPRKGIPFDGGAAEVHGEHAAGLWNEV